MKQPLAELRLERLIARAGFILPGVHLEEIGIR
jgi:hypothetical protein